MKLTTKEKSYVWDVIEGCLWDSIQEVNDLPLDEQSAVSSFTFREAIKLWNKLSKEGLIQSEITFNEETGEEQ